MKKELRNSLAALIKSGTAITTLAAFFTTSTGSLWAGPPDDRKHSEDAVKHLKHIIVIYQENWSFDSLYGQFPGASGYALGFGDSAVVLLRKRNLKPEKGRHKDLRKIEALTGDLT